MRDKAESATEYAARIRRSLWLPTLVTVEALWWHDWEIVVAVFDIRYDCSDDYGVFKAVFKDVEIFLAPGRGMVRERDHKLMPSFFRLVTDTGWTLNCCHCGQVCEQVGENALWCCDLFFFNLQNVVHETPVGDENALFCLQVFSNK
jgi:hypothetical protein